ncbi:CxxxxCH/CxxCH domain c-type cytochrome [Geotalea daltonii]|uniref:CxxxxCH/CxxCH domain c-type cytochrome n=1 Tax=Geotalea daltonii TaxID=1203471 RepID=UPI0018A8399E|nr:CxxxxCH/CxxCH domain-containing protein [Geotalea daltonii]
MGNHRTHMANGASVASCDTCHVKNTTFGHRDGKISFRADINASPATTTYLKAGVLGFVNQTSNPVMTNANCSNVNCHFETTSPSWGLTAAAAGLNCESCHNSANTSSAHTKHKEKYGSLGSNYLDSCSTCHPNRSTFSHATSANNAGRNIAITVSSYAGSNFKYLPSEAASRVLGSCNNLYCHSSGQSATGGSTPVYATPNWGDTASGACGSCHATTTLASGSHTKHFSGISPNTNCGNCHAGATSTSYASTLHVDTFINVTGAYTQGKSHAPGNGYGACNAASCHDNGKGVPAATPTWGNSTVPACTACHTLIPADNSHNKHVTTTTYKKAACGDCHTGYVQGATAAANHLNTTIEVNTGGYPSPKAKNSTVGSCATSYCHSSGQSLTGDAAPVYGTAPTWGQSVACGSCHATTTLASGSHTKHFSGISPNTNCGNCHAGATSTSYASTLHVDTFINVTGAYTQGKSHAPGNGYGACNAASCHDNGKGVPAATPTWGNSTVPACTACHTLIPADNSHNKHVTTTTYKKAACGDCHTGYVQGATAAANHLNTTIEVNTGGYPSPKAKNSTVGSCATSYCHSSGQSLTGGAAPVYGTAPTWGQSVACGSCHATTTLASGSHTKHFSGISPNTNCGNCHAGATSTSYASTLHVDTFINVTGAYTQGKSHAPGNGYGACNAASCHDNGKGVPAATPTWGNSTVPACTACHTLIPADNSHNKHVTTTTYKKAACGDCHTGYVQGATAAANHLNTTIEVNTGGYPSPKAKNSTVGSCATSYCHSSGQSLTGGAAPVYGTAPTWGQSVACGSCHATTTLASGSHTKHFSGISPNTNCGNCHAGATSTSYASTLHVDTFINVTGAYTQGKSHAPGNGYGACNAASCHDNGKGVPAATPTWGNSTVPACTACHTLIPADNSHNKHVTTTTYKKAACGDCHTGYVQGATAAANHLNTTIEVNTGGYPSPKAKNSTVGSCATSYCHSSGQSLTGGAAPVYGTAPTWGQSVACGSCHATTTLASGSHTKHFSGISPNTNCGNCHAGATSTSYASTLHVDTFINVTGAYTQGKSHAPGNGYGACNAASCHDNGKGVPAATPTWGNSTVPACTACHTLIPADNSHNKHVTTTTYKKAACGDCHTGYVQGATAAANHLNTTIEVNTGGYLSPKAKNSLVSSCTTSSCHSNGKGSSQSVTWGQASLNCKSCHPALGGAHSRHMGGFDGVNAMDWANLPFYQYTSTKSTGADSGTPANYAFGCANCHPITSLSHVNGTIDVTLDTTGNVSSLRAKNASAGFAGTTVGTNTLKCQNVYCHSDGKGGQTTTLAWNQTSTASERCAKCHGNSPADATHQAHVSGGIHADNVFNGTSGLLSAGSTGSVSHGIAGQQTTINCNICHSGTVTSARNAANSACVSCHGGDASPVYGSIADLSNHVNGNVNVSFADTTIYSKAQLRPTSFAGYTSGTAGWVRNGDNYKNGAAAFDYSKNKLAAQATWTAGPAGQSSCSNVVCHNMKAGQPAVKWSDTLSCDSCHTSL